MTHFGSLCLVVALSGCAGAASTQCPKTTAPSRVQNEIATGNTLTEFQRTRLLGHYSTEDGTSGFILDRTGSAWKVKLDGTTAVSTMSDSPGPFDSREYRSGDHSIWLRVSPTGEVDLFQGPKQTEGVRVVRDADANRLQ